MKAQLTGSLLLLAAMLALASAIPPYGRCKPGSGMTSFDPDKFAGEWFEVAAMGTCKGTCEDDDSSEGNVTCSRATYKVTHDANRTTTTFVYDEKLDDADFQRLGTWVGVPYSPGNYTVVRTVNEEVGDDLMTEVSVHAVVATDYTSSALVYLCRHSYVEETNSLDVNEYLLAWSRTPRGNVKVRQMIDRINAASESHENRFTDVSTDNC